MLNELTSRYPALEMCKNDIEKAISSVINCYENGGKLLLCGNGGSCADCDHITGELMKGFHNQRPLSDAQKTQMKQNCSLLDGEILAKLQCGLPAISLSSLTALNTAFCNDVDADLVYAQGVMALGKRGDILVAISTSGNSSNVLQAVKVAKGLGLTVVALTGESGGKLKELADVSICVAESETYKIQELHLPVYHHICARVEQHFFS